MPEASRGKSIGMWVLSGLLAALFVFAGSAKLMGSQETVEGFKQFGFPDWFRLFIGACEVAGGIALLIPRLASLSAVGLLIIMIGAIGTCIKAGLSPVLPGVVLLLLAGVVWLRRSGS